MLVTALDDDVPLDVEIFEKLWRAHACVHIPDTIVWKFGKLEGWFFNRQGGSARHGLQPAPRVKRKRDSTVHRSDMLTKVAAAMMAGSSHGHEIVATWVSAEPGDPTSRVLHLTRDTMEKFLRHVPDKGHGVLQKWVPPFGGRACLLRTEWSPHHHAVELRTNWRPLYDLKVELGRRLATFVVLRE